MPLNRNKHRLASVLLQFSLDPSRWDELVHEIQPHQPSVVDQDNDLADQLAEAELLSWQMRGQPSPADTAYSWLIVDRAGVLRMRHDACETFNRPRDWSQLLQEAQVGTQLRWHSASHQSAANQAMIDAGKQNGGHTLLTLSGPKDSQASTHAIVTGAAYAPASLQPLVPADGFVITLPTGSLTQSCRLMLRDGFGVTAAEMALIERLSAGDDLNAAASNLAITTNTARNQVKSVFRKTGVRRQADLLLLIAHSATLGAPVVGGLAAAPARRFLTCEDGRRIAYRIYGEGGQHQALGFHEGLGSSLMPPVQMRWHGNTIFSLLWQTGRVLVLQTLCKSIPTRAS